MARNYDFRHFIFTFVSDEFQILPGSQYRITLHMLGNGFVAPMTGLDTSQTFELNPQTAIVFRYKDDGPLVRAPWYLVESGSPQSVWGYETFWLP